MAETNIKHQNYYGGDKLYEAVKVIRAWGLNFNLGSTVKYIVRAGKKDPSKLIEDLEKAHTFLGFEIAHLKKLQAEEEELKRLSS